MRPPVAYTSTITKRTDKHNYTVKSFFSLQQKFAGMEGSIPPKFKDLDSIILQEIDDNDEEIDVIGGVQESYRSVQFYIDTDQHVGETYISKTGVFQKTDFSMFGLIWADL